MQACVLPEVDAPTKTRSKDGYEIDKLVKKINKKSYQVRWVGYPPSEDTEEPENHLVECLGRAYFNQLKTEMESKKARSECTIDGLYGKIRKGDEIIYRVKWLG